MRPWTLPAASGPQTRRRPASSAGTTLTILGQAIPRGRMIEVRADAPCELAATVTASAVLLLLQGTSDRRACRATHGPFVMNTAAEIQQAFADYQPARSSAAGRSRAGTRCARQGTLRAARRWPRRCPAPPPPATDRRCPRRAGSPPSAERERGRATDRAEPYPMNDRTPAIAPPRPGTSRAARRVVARRQLSFSQTDLSLRRSLLREPLAREHIKPRAVNHWDHARPSTS